MPHQIIRPSFVREDERGTLRELLNSGTWRSVIQGEMAAGAVMGDHYHKETQVFFYLISGSLDAITEDIITGERDSFSLRGGEGVILMPNESHKLTFTGDTVYLLLKSNPYDPNAPDTYHHPL